MSVLKNLKMMRSEIKIEIRIEIKIEIEIESEIKIKIETSNEKFLNEMNEENQSEL